jgi:hypothetical protein
MVTSLMVTSLMVTSLLVSFPPSAYFAIIYPDHRMYYGVRTNAGSPGQYHPYYP